MGRTFQQYSTIHSPSHLNGNTRDSRTSTKNPLPLSSSNNSPSGRQTNHITPNTNTWALPLESLVLKNWDVDLTVAFLQIYHSILQKFSGAPCDALGRTVTYLQSVLTESPAFHPYVMHLPFGRLPKTDADGLIVAVALEKELIRIVQRLVAFYGDIEAVLKCIDDCPEKLIPHPQFVIAEERPLPNNGVEGYNNKHPGGQELWQNPIPPTSFWRLQQEKDALRVNIARCADWIERKRVSAVSTPVMAMPRGRQPQPPTTSSVMDDISLIEAGITRLFELVSKG